MAENYFTKVCPLIRPISTSGGTFYTFSSAGEDFTLSISESSTTKFKFSKFALIKIPEFSDTPNIESNAVRLEAIPGAYVHMNDGSNSNSLLNISFAESFQNYCLNLETLLLSQTTYDMSENLTVSERVFFKWLKEMGSIRFQNTTLSNTNQVLYAEENNSANYERVVKYIGDIDVVNHYTNAVNSYSEVYVHVPTSAGSFKDVYFKSVQDSNYKPKMVVSKPTPDIFLAGRSDENYIIYSRAFYDEPLQLNSGTTLKNYVLPSVDKLQSYVTTSNYGWWFNNSTLNKNAYHIEETFDDVTNDILAIGTGTNIVDYTIIKRNRLDGISIDFNADDYTSIDSDIESLSDVGKTSYSQDFEFNAVLFYYDLYEDVVDEYGDSVQNVLSTNLFGVLFLDNVDTSTTNGGKIPSFQKCIPNKTTKLNGNAFGIKLNFKLNISPISSDVNVETIISDSNTMSMDIFVDALNQVKTLTENITQNSYDTLSMDTRIRMLEESQNSINNTSVANIQEQLTQLQNIITSQNYLINAQDKKDITDLIRNNYDMLYDILQNKTSVNVALDLGAIKIGDGLDLFKGDNYIKVSSNSQEYNFGERYKIYPPTDDNHIYERWTEYNRNQVGISSYYKYEIGLKPLKNYIRLTNNGIDFIPRGDFYLYINDGSVDWKTGQTMRLYFEDQYNMLANAGNYNFYIYTDFNNMLKSKNNYSALIGKITAQDFKSRNMKPLMEIHCVNPTTFEFLIDFIN